MTGNLYIDGKDIYTPYRILVAASGYGDLAAFPALKTVDSNDWAEEDGAEFDLSAPKLDTREVSVAFAFHGNEAAFGNFMEVLSDGAYHDFYFTEIGRTYRLRLVSQQSMSQVQTLGKFSLRFADDFPLSGYAYTVPQSSITIPQRGYELDGRDLSEYGVCVLRGNYAEIHKSPAVKTALLQNMKSRAGAVYDGEAVFFQTKEVRLECLMRAATLTEFWRNHDALLYDLSRPDERILYVDSTGSEYPCYYKSCSVSGFVPNGKIWFQFSLVLVFTSFRVDGDEFLLTAEDGALVITEQDDYAINLSVYGN
jgi:hypothetical protein